MKVSGARRTTVAELPRRWHPAAWHQWGPPRKDHGSRSIAKRRLLEYRLWLDYRRVSSITPVVGPWNPRCRNAGYLRVLGRWGLRKHGDLDSLACLRDLVRCVDVSKLGGARKRNVRFTEPFLSGTHNRYGSFTEPPSQVPHMQ